MSKRNVTVEAATVGVNFGCVGVVRNTKSRRKLATTDDVYPHGNRAAAISDAEALAGRKGWSIVEGE